MLPIIIGAGVGVIVIGKWIHKSMTDAQRAEQEWQITWQANERSVRLQREAAIAQERTRALAYVDQNLAQIAGSLGFALQKLPSGRGRSYLLRLDARTTVAKSQIMGSSTPMGTAYESVSELLKIRGEALAEAATITSQ
jgi:hypothetical protein